MTPAEELTSAADKLDALIAEATSGPWTLAKTGASTKDPGRIVGLDGGPAGYDEVITTGEVRCGSYCYGGTSVIDAADADWRYIAAVNPLVGKALAAALRTEAETIVGWDPASASSHAANLLPVARLINGGGS